AAIERREVGLLAFTVALGEADGRVELQHNVIAVRAHSGDCSSDAIRFGHSVIDRVSQFAKQVFQVIVELQGWLPSTTNVILGLRFAGYKQVCAAAVSKWSTGLSYSFAMCAKMTT